MPKRFVRDSGSYPVYWISVAALLKQMCLGRAVNFNGQYISGIKYIYNLVVKISVV